MYQDWTGIQIAFAVCIVIIAVLGVLADWFYQQAKQEREAGRRSRDFLFKAHRALVTNDFICDHTGEWKLKPGTGIGYETGRLLQRISDLEAERDMLKNAEETKLKENEAIKRLQTLATNLDAECIEYRSIILDCHKQAHAHQCKDPNPGRIRNGAEACRWIAGEMKSVVETYKADVEHVVDVHG
jgi:hypothetical protein